MPDMLVRLYDLPDEAELLKRLEAEGVRIRRAMAPDKFRIVPWVQEHSSLSGAGECDVCFANSPISLFVATKGKTLIGYACYNATCRDFFGPMRVLDEHQGKGIGKALLLRALRALREEGYAYAIIGGVGPAGFYQRAAGAILIEGSAPGIYADYLGGPG